MEGKPVNLNSLFLTWWYGEAIGKVLTYFGTLLRYLADFFSVKVCLTTLFSVWKRDYHSGQGLSLQQRFRVIMENVASRFIGLCVKSAVLLTFLVVSFCIICFIILFVLLWLLYPLMLASLVISGLISFLR